MIIALRLESDRSASSDEALVEEPRREGLEAHAAAGHTVVEITIRDRSQSMHESPLTLERRSLGHVPTPGVANTERSVVVMTNRGHRVLSQVEDEENGEH
jgi:hypothetical protein